MCGMRLSWHFLLILHSQQSDFSHARTAKFTRSGTITVTGGVSENGRHIYLAVEDTGVGIPKDKFGQIFGAFKQVGLKC